MEKVGEKSARLVGNINEDWGLPHEYKPWLQHMLC